MYLTCSRSMLENFAGRSTSRLDVLTPLGTLSSVPCSLVVMQQSFTYMARREGLGRSGAKQQSTGGCFSCMGGRGGIRQTAVAFEALRQREESADHSGVAMGAKTRSLLTRTHFVCISPAKST
jgi:hypothetical protein